MHRVTFRFISLTLLAMVANILLSLESHALGRKQTQLHYEVEGTTAIRSTLQWSVEKNADQPFLELEPGQAGSLMYSISATPKTAGRQSYEYQGVLRIRNPGRKTAKIPYPKIVISPDITPSLDCRGAVFPNHLPEGRSLECAFTVRLPDTSERNLVVSEETSKGDLPSISSLVDFSMANTIQTDRCIDVRDSESGALGTFCYSPETPSHTLRFARSFGPYSGCGETVAKTQVSFRAHDTGSTGRGECAVRVRVLCEGEKLH